MVLPLILLATVELGYAVSAAGSGSGARISIDPAEIAMGMFYDGATVHVSGQIPTGYDPVLTCEGNRNAVELKKKGKVFKVLWMNVADVNFENIPSIYLLSAPRKLHTIAPPAVLEQLGVGYRALASKAHTSLQNEERHRLFGELVKLKESEELYAVNEEGLRLEPWENETVRLSASFFLSPKTPEGDYEIRLFGFKDGWGKLLCTGRLHLRRAGMTAFIFSLAQHHGLLYGVLAVIVALVVGLLTGFVFGLGSKSSH